jgi:hypothetical protein
MSVKISISQDKEMAKQTPKKAAAKKTPAKKQAAKKTAPKKKAAAKKQAPKKDVAKKVYKKMEVVATEHGIDIDAYEDKAIEFVENASEKVIAEIEKHKKGFLKKLFSWIKK